MNTERRSALRPSFERRGHLSSVGIGLALFAVWTVIARLGIADGSRHTVWAKQHFGTWPASLTQLDGSATMTLSIHAQFASGGTLGWTTTGRTSDFGDPDDLNGSRFVTGTEAGPVSSIAVHVGEPVDEPPHNQFQAAVYADRNGAPGHLLAASATGSLEANRWNRVPIAVTLEPHTAYWLMYNTNGSSEGVNNLTLTPAVGNPLDTVIRRPGAPPHRMVDSLAEVAAALGHPLTTILALALLVLGTGRGSDRRVLAAVFGLGLAAATLLEIALKHTVFAPFGAYPSGHAIRATLVATVLAAAVRGRVLRMGIVLLAVVACLGLVRARRHYAEETVGGALAGWALGAASLTVAARLDSRLRRETGGSDDTVNRRTRRDRRIGERRSAEATYNPAT